MHNDGLILAETSLAAIPLLVTSDKHLLDMDENALLLGVHRSLGAMILRGERQLTLRHVRTLAAHFGVSADLFIGPSASPRD